MLEKINLEQKLDKETYRANIDGLLQRLFDAQQRARAAGLPVMVVLEGWDESGKGRAIQSMSARLDARGVRVHPTGAPTEEEAAHPFLWRFWLRLPAKGMIAIFDRGWYGRVLTERVEKLVKKKVWKQAYGAINEFERQLTDDGYVLVKLWLHISKAEQRKRIKNCLKDDTLRWKISKADLRQHHHYEEWAEAVEDLLSETGTSWAPWTIVEAEDLRFGEVKIIESIIDAIDSGIHRQELAKARVSGGPEPPPCPAPMGSSILSHVDLSLSLTKDEYEKELPRQQVRLHDLMFEARDAGVPVVVAYEGWDAAGKGGNIRRIIQTLDPRQYEVISIAAPTSEEKARHYLWRFWRALPAGGRLTVFDRTWYGRVLVERVEGFCSSEAWHRAYREINEFEEQLTDFGTVLVKLFLHISQDEQLRRFKERQDVAYKRWKITDEDWRNREKWGLYEPAVVEMLERTSTRVCPWTIVEGNCKYYARVKAVRTLCEAIEQRL
jgi:polyphosphate:AMP phosphotransferase